MTVQYRRKAPYSFLAVLIATALFCLAAAPPSFGQDGKDGGKFDGAVFGRSR
jgi:hypothetical protein